MSIQSSVSSFTDSHALNQEFWFGVEASQSLAPSASAFLESFAPAQYPSKLSSSQQAALPVQITGNTALVVGAGTVGLSLALSLLKQGYQVVVLDKVMPAAWGAENFDLRLMAVNQTNIDFLTRLGAWQQISQLAVNPYQQLSLYSAKHAETSFFAHEINLPQLGYMVETNALITGLLQACKQYAGFFFLSAVEVTSAQRKALTAEFYSISSGSKPVASDYYWEISLNNGLTLYTSQVLAADGGNSFWRKQARIGVDIHSYPTKCMLLEVEAAPEVVAKFKHHTWQYIDQHGPKAWLPVSASKGVLCWYDQIPTIDRLLALSPEQLALEVKASFPADRLWQANGAEYPFKVLKAASFPLARQRALNYQQHNVVLFGDAAHTVTPLAGQGLNLGLQDVLCFDLLLANPTITSLPTLVSNYASERYLDNTCMQEFLSILHHSYISRSPVAGWIKDALFKVNQIGAIKRYALDYACGNRDLLRGISLVRNSIGNFFADLGKK